MRVSLVYVGVGVAGFNADRPLGDREGSWISHGLGSISASCKAAGFDTDIVDLRQFPDWDAFRELVANEPSDVYGLGVSAVDYAQALNAVLIIKQTAPKAKIIVGGIHPTIFPDQYDFRVIDSVIVGEGEITFVDVCKQIARGIEPLKLVRGIQPDLDALPWVDRESWDYRRELSCSFAPDQLTPSITMLAGRGCAFHCGYCQPAESAVFGRPFRMRSPENVLAEMDALYTKYRFKSVTFWDDTFTFSNKWIQRFCDIYPKDRFSGATIAACSRADILVNHPSIAERLASIGVDWLVIGLETGSQRLLDFINKGTTVEENYEAVRICKANGIKTFATIMFGLPTETREESTATARMIDEIQPEFTSPFWFLPIEGTDLHTYCAENDLILDETKHRTIERTGRMIPTIKGVDYDYIRELLEPRMT